MVKTLHVFVNRQLPQKATAVLSWWSQAVYDLLQ